MAKKKDDQAQEGYEDGNSGENAAQIDEGQGETPDMNPDKTEQQEAGNAGENADTSPDVSEPEGEGKQGEELNDPDQGSDDTPPAPPDPGKVAVVSESRRGKTIFAVSGDPIVFDNEGKATVNEEDALYLKSCPGFIVG
jgi:hypothetical protein